MVHVTGRFNVGAISSPAGTLRISLPFTSANLAESGGDASGSISMSGLVSLPASDAWLIVPQNAAYLDIYMADGTDVAADSAQQCDTGTSMRINVTYMV